MQHTHSLRQHIRGSSCTTARASCLEAPLCTYRHALPRTCRRPVTAGGWQRGCVLGTPEHHSSPEAVAPCIPNAAPQPVRCVGQATPSNTQPHTLLRPGQGWAPGSTAPQSGPTPGCCPVAGPPTPPPPQQHKQKTNRCEPPYRPGRQPCTTPLREVRRQKQKHAHTAALPIRLASGASLPRLSASGGHPPTGARLPPPPP